MSKDIKKIEENSQKETVSNKSLIVEDKTNESNSKSKSNKNIILFVIIGILVLINVVLVIFFSYLIYPKVKSNFANTEKDKIELKYTETTSTTMMVVYILQMYPKS